MLSCSPRAALALCPARVVLHFLSSTEEESHSQADFPTLSISTLAGVISSHFPEEPCREGSVVLVPSQRGQILSLGCHFLWSAQAASRVVLLALSQQGFCSSCPEDLPCSSLCSPPAVHTP